MNKGLLTFLLLCFFLVAVGQDPITLTLSGIEAEFIKVPGGQFQMGSDSSNTNAQRDEFPKTTVTITKDFYLGKTEVTQRLWESVMGYNPSVFAGSDRPVEMVSWDDCKVFIDKLNAIWEGAGTFRLPTEAEWERACRLGEPEYRDDRGVIDEWKLFKYAQFNSRSEGASHPVGSKAADAMGFYDMQGNLWEWCEDWKGSYSGGSEVDPQGPATGTLKIYRGGSWFNEPQALRAENRNAHPPSHRFTNAGLRLVYEAP